MKVSSQGQGVDKAQHVGQQPYRPKVGDRVRGCFGEGTVCYVVPAGHTTRGWAEIDGAGKYDTYDPSSLTLIEKITNIEKKAKHRGKASR